MTRRCLSLFALALTGWLAMPCARGADATNPAPDFKEVYDLLRTNLAGATDDNLNRAAMEGLIAGGVAPVIKHVPGHGRARADSHFELPIVMATRACFWRAICTTSRWIRVLRRKVRVRL